MAGQLTHQIIHGDCIEVMRTLDAESVDAIVTSPPYAMQRKDTYGGIPESEYPEWTAVWMSEVWRILKPNGSVLINIRPHIKNGQISDYTLRTRLKLREVGWTECEELIWNKKGGAPLGSTKRPRRSWESIHWFAKHGRPNASPKAAGALTTRIGLSGGRAGPHLSTTQSNANSKKEFNTARVPDVASYSTRLNANDNTLNTHSASYPWQLAEWCGKLVMPEGGTILDPFSGSASTGIAAIRSGWNYIGIELDQGYADMSRLRLAKELGHQPAA